MAEFPELQGLDNSDCVQTNPVRVDPIIVSAAYGSVDDAFVEQEPLLGADADPEAWDAFHTLFQDGTDSLGASVLGYQDGFEHEVWTSWKIQASAAKNNTALYLPGAKARIVALATEAFEILIDISEIYELFESDQKSLPLKNGLAMPFPLSTSEEEVADHIDLEASGLWESSRTGARRDIREAYYKVGKLLWCALYGRNQSVVWRENKAIFDEAQELLEGQLEFSPEGGAGPGLEMTLGPKPTSPGTPGGTLVPKPDLPGFDEPGGGRPRDPDIGGEGFSTATKAKTTAMGLGSILFGVAFVGVAGYGIYRLVRD